MTGCEALIMRAEKSADKLEELGRLAAAFDSPSMHDAVACLRDAAAVLKSSAEGWRPISDEARTGASVLVYGLPQAIEGVAFRKPAVFTAHWDAIDNSFCLDGGTWLGPFIEPTHWMPKPTPPEGK